MRRKAGILCKFLGLLLLAAAVLLFTYNKWDDYRAGRTAARIQVELENTIIENAQEQSDASVTADAQTDPDANKDNGTDADNDVNAAMDTVEIDGYSYIGILSIPVLELELPIMSEWSYAGMKIAPGRYNGSVWTDDLIICGHNYARHFGNLKYLKAGDVLYFTDINGNVFNYEVEEILIFEPEDVEEMISQETGEWDLTLFTCTIGGQTRVTVRCSRTL